MSRACCYVHQTSDGRFLKHVGSHRMPINMGGAEKLTLFSAHAGGAPT
jgi:hypothetical protein